MIAFNFKNDYFFFTFFWCLFLNFPVITFCCGVAINFIPFFQKIATKFQNNEWLFVNSSESIKVCFAINFSVDEKKGSCILLKNEMHDFTTLKSNGCTLFLFLIK